MELTDHISAKVNLDWPVWMTMNRIRVVVGRFKENQVKRDLPPDEYTNCDFG